MSNRSLTNLRAAAILSSALLLAGTAAEAAGGADAAGAGQQSGRFRIEKTDAGFVRFDTQTGAISICSIEQAQLACRAVAEDGQAGDDEVARLQARVSALEARLNQLDKSGVQTQSSLPSEAEFEQTMNYMERFVKRFLSITKSLDDAPEPAKPDPSRT